MLAESRDWRPSCLGLIFYVLGGDEATLLEVPVSKVEVFKALSNLNRGTTLGMDSFSLALWQFNWNFVKDLVMGFFSNLYEHYESVKCLNASLMMLVA